MFQTTNQIKTEPLKNWSEDRADVSSPWPSPWSSHSRWNQNHPGYLCGDKNHHPPVITQCCFLGAIDFPFPAIPSHGWLIPRILHLRLNQRPWRVRKPRIPTDGLAERRELVDHPQVISPVIPVGFLKDLSTEINRIIAYLLSGMIQQVVGFCRDSQGFNHRDPSVG